MLYIFNIYHVIQSKIQVSFFDIFIAQKRRFRRRTEELRGANFQGGPSRDPNSRREVLGQQLKLTKILTAEIEIINKTE